MMKFGAMKLHRVWLVVGLVTVVGASGLLILQREWVFRSNSSDVTREATLENNIWLEKARATVPLVDRLLIVGARPEKFSEQAQKDLRQATPDEKAAVLEELTELLSASDKSTLNEAHARTAWLWSLRPNRRLFPGALGDSYLVQQTRRRALQLLGPLVKSEDQKARLSKGLRTLIQNPASRAIALESVLTIDGAPRPEILSLAAQYAAEYNANPRVAQLSFAVLERGGSSSLEHLLRLLKSDEPDVSQNALRLAKILLDRRGESFRDALDPLIVGNDVSQPVQMQLLRWLYEKDPTPTKYVAELRAALDRLNQLDLVKPRENEVSDMDFILNLLGALPMQGLEAQENLMPWAQAPFMPLDQVRGQLQDRVAKFLLRSPWMQDTPTRLVLQDAEKNYDLQRKTGLGPPALAR